MKKLVRNRKCKVRECITKLNQYNKGDYCDTHKVIGIDKHNDKIQKDKELYAQRMRLKKNSEKQNGKENSS